jgi:uncharacterized protein YndB with AHSA1/START domain
VTGTARIDRASAHVPAPADTVLAAFLDAEALATWLPPIGMTGRVDTMDARPGGGFTMVLRHETGGLGKSSATDDHFAVRFTEIDPPRRIVWSVRFKTEDPLFHGDMRQDWTFASVPDGTEVAVACTDVPPGIRSEDHAAGLAASLANLTTHFDRADRDCL